MLIQFGITLITPLLLCIALCFWLCDAFGIGEWIYLPGILLGLGASGVSSYRFFMDVVKWQDKKKSKHKAGSSKKGEAPTSFNDHI